MQTLLLIGLAVNICVTVAMLKKFSDVVSRVDAIKQTVDSTMDVMWTIKAVTVGGIMDKAAVVGNAGVTLQKSLKKYFHKAKNAINGNDET